MDKELAKVINENGGVAYYVGGTVRDALLGKESKDVDIEIFGITQDTLETILASFGEVNLVGKSFGVYKLGNLDISLPRIESKNGVGHKGFTIHVDPQLTVRKAMRRRDFTINAIYQNVLTGEIVDLYGGQQDLENRILRVVDRDTFKEDSLRVLRAGQFASRFGFEVVDADYMRTIDLTDLPAERIWGEMEKLLLGDNVRHGLEVLDVVGAINQLFPELDVLRTIEQDAVWHSEGWGITELPSIPSVAILTNSERLMRSYGTQASDASKVVRVMFEIPLSRMDAIMDTAVNDFEIVQNIVSPILVYMMDVLGTKQGSTKSDTHNVTMQPDTSIYSSNTGFNVTSLIADFRPNSVNDNVIFTVEGFISDTNAIHTEYYTADKATYQVKIGDVWTHTLMVMDVANRIVLDLPKAERLTVMLACLFHDLGKATTTEVVEGRVKAHGHSEAGVPIASALLDKLNVFGVDGFDVRTNVLDLIDRHLIPAQLHNLSQKETVKDSVFRRLSTKVNVKLLALVCKADVLGRGGEVNADCVDWFNESIAGLDLVDNVIEPILKGRHLIELGMKPSKEFGVILNAVFEKQLDGGVTTLEEALLEIPQV